MLSCTISSHCRMAVRAAKSGRAPPIAAPREACRSGWATAIHESRSRRCLWSSMIVVCACLVQSMRFSQRVGSRGVGARPPGDCGGLASACPREADEMVELAEAVEFCSNVVYRGEPTPFVLNCHCEIQSTAPCFGPRLHAKHFWVFCDDYGKCEFARPPAQSVTGPGTRRSDRVSKNTALFSLHDCTAMTTATCAT